MESQFLLVKKNLLKKEKLIKKIHILSYISDALRVRTRDNLEVVTIALNVRTQWTITIYRRIFAYLAVRNRRTFHLLFVIRRSTIYVVIVDIREEVSARARSERPRWRVTNAWLLPTRSLAPSARRMYHKQLRLTFNTRDRYSAGC